MPDTETNTNTEFTAESFKILQDQLKKQTEKTQALEATHQDLEKTFTETLPDEIKELIPDGLNLNQKILFTKKLTDKFKSFGKNSTPTVTDPENKQPSRKSKTLDTAGLTGMAALRAGLKHHNKL